MDQVFASKLAGKPVLTTDGVELGTLENVTIDTENGDLETLLIAPERPDIDRFDRDEEGRLLVSADRLSTLGADYLLVDGRT